MKIEKAIDNFKKGEFVLIYDSDDRERETDLVIGAEFVTPDSIYRMRNDGGGLIILMIHNKIGEKLGLPYLADLFYKEGIRWPVLKELIPNDIPYDSKSSFSITINHRKTFTGITDENRALTISEFAGLWKEIEGMDKTDAQRKFGEKFRAPGHVPICRASKGLLKERKGHTELGVALASMAKIVPVVSACEMMGRESSCSKEEARKYAEKNGLTFLNGEEIVEEWKKWSE